MSYWEIVIFIINVLFLTLKYLMLMNSMIENSLETCI